MLNYTSKKVSKRIVKDPVKFRQWFSTVCGKFKVSVVKSDDNHNIKVKMFKLNDIELREIYGDDIHTADILISSSMRLAKTKFKIEHKLGIPSLSMLYKENFDGTGTVIYTKRMEEPTHRGYTPNGMSTLWFNETRPFTLDYPIRR